jgi:protein-disulfide isomerase
VRAEMEHAIKSGLIGTPTYFVNGKQIQNPTSVEAFRAIIKDAISGKQ